MANSTVVFETDTELSMDPSRSDGPDHKLSGSDISEIAILLIIALVGIIGNSLVKSVYTGIGTKGQRTNASIYILNLAAADLITLAIIVMLEISEFFKILWPIVWRYDIQCQLYRIGRFLCLDITVFLMMAIAIDRYMAVVHPLHYKQKYTNKRTKYFLMVLWIVAGLLATPVGINFTTVYDKVVRGPNHGVCAVSTMFVVKDVNLMGAYIFLVLFFIPALTTGIVYTTLVAYVRRHNSEFASHIHDTSRVRSNHWKMAKILLAVYLSYVVCYTPHLLLILARYVGRRLLSQTVQRFFLELPYANSCINPIIYLAMNKSFRTKVIEKFSRKGARGEAPKPTVSTGLIAMVSHLKSDPAENSPPSNN